MMPTGGVTADNAGEWIKAGAVALGAGGSLTAGAKTGDYAHVGKAPLFHSCFYFNTLKLLFQQLLFVKTV